MDKKSLILSSFFVLATALWAQKKESVVATVDGQPIYLSRFTDALYKDGAKKTNAEIKDFLETYINYKLNVMEGRNEKLDTTARYQRDYQSSRILMSKPYVTDTAFQAQPYVENLYNKMQETVELNHTILKFDKGRYFPADTLALYNKALTLREKLLKNGFKGSGYQDNTESISMTDDIENHNGYIGWATPLMLSPSVAKTAENIPIGQISMPIRSADGYHIIQVLNKRKILGSYKIDMVPFYFPVNATQQQKDSVRQEVEEVRREIKEGALYDDLCAAYLHAMGDGRDNCSIGYVNSNSPQPANLISEVFSLTKIGEISKPVESNNEYSLLRLTDIKPMPPYSKNVQKQLSEQIDKSKHIAEYISSLGYEYTNKYGLNIDKAAYQKLEDVANEVYPEDTLFLKKVTNLDADLFTIGNKRTYKVRNFVYFVDAFVRASLPDPELKSPPAIVMKEIVNIPLSTDKLSNLLNRYITSCVRLYADSTLEERIPEFKAKMQDISDELLAFEVLDKHVLQPSMNDKVGLQAYFEANKDKYQWKGKRFKGFVIYANDKNVLDETKLYLQNDSERSRRSQSVRIEEGIWSEGDNDFVDNVIFGKNKSVTLPKGFTLFDVVGRFINAPETYSDVKSQIENDYMEYLQNEWTKNLRKKYSVKINDSVLKEIQ